MANTKVNIRPKCTNSSCQMHSKCNPYHYTLTSKKPDIAIYQTQPTNNIDSETLLNNILNHLSTKYDFSYLNSFICKNKVYTKACETQIKKEIDLYKPKVVVALGEKAHAYFHGLDVIDSKQFMLEEGCLRKKSFFDSKIVTISGVSPSFCFKNYPLSAGFIYTVCEKAILYALHKQHFNIPNKFKTHYITSIKEARKILKNMAGQVAVDTETASLNRVYDNRLLTVQLCNDGLTGYVFPVSHYQCPFTPDEQQELKQLLHDFFTKSLNIDYFIMHNAKFDRHQLYRELKVLLYCAPVVDTAFAEFCLEENWEKVNGMFPKRKGPYSLFTCAYKRGFSSYGENDKANRDKLAFIPIEEWLDYAATDAVVTYNIYKSQVKYAEAVGYANFNAMTVKYGDLLSRVLCYTEHCGLPTNINVIRELYNPRTSPLKKELENVLNEFNECLSVKDVNKKLTNKATGSTKTLFGSKNLFDPNKASHKEMLFLDTLKLEPVESQNKAKKKGESAKPSFDKHFQKVYSNIKEVALLTEYQGISKLISSYINNIYDFMNKTTGNPDFYTDYRVRPSFQALAVTGRLTANKPNSQQRPSRGSRAGMVLRMYEAPKGRACIKLDYSTFEVRGLGFVSEDKAMIKSFLEIEEIKKKFRKNPAYYAKDGYNILAKEIKQRYKKATKEERKAIKVEFEELKKRYKTDKVYFSKKYVDIVTDFHKHSASLFFKTPLLEVVKDQRSKAKNFVFGSVYGMSISTIAKNLGILLEEANEIYKTFMSKMPFAVKWLEKSKELGRKLLYVESPIGRRRRVWANLFPKSKKGILGQMDRLCMNSVIQGFCSDLNIIATSLLIKHIYSMGKAKYQVPDSESYMVCNLVHDSCEMEVPIEDVKKCLNDFEHFFTCGLEKYVLEEFGYKIKIPVAVDFAVGLSFDKMKDWNGSNQNAVELQKWILEQEKLRT